MIKLNNWLSSEKKYIFLKNIFSDENNEENNNLKFFENMSFVLVACHKSINCGSFSFR